MYQHELEVNQEFEFNYDVFCEMFKRPPVTLHCIFQRVCSMIVKMFRAILYCVKYFVCKAEYFSS